MTFATACGISILNFGQLIPSSDPVLLFLFFMVFNISLLMFWYANELLYNLILLIGLFFAPQTHTYISYMMSSFFKTATIAALSGIVAYLASFLPFMVAITLENEISLFYKVITCFSMSTSFCFGMMYMTRFEGWCFDYIHSLFAKIIFFNCIIFFLVHTVQGVGMQWSNLWHSPMQGDPMNVGTAMIMMMADSLIYFFVAWYISHVNPRKSSVINNYFCVTFHGIIIPFITH